MEFQKKHLLAMENGYAVAAAQLFGEQRLITASEGKGPAHIFLGPEMNPSVMTDGPGGCMGFASIPRHDDAVFMISRFYPIFKGESAGIELLRAPNGINGSWTCERVLDVPMVHRISTLSTSNGDYLFAASICGGKDFQDDWSKPGTVYACKIPENLEGLWEMEPVLTGIHKNHGMTIVNFNGVDGLVIAGEEGVFAITPQDIKNNQIEWSHRKLISHEISEAVFIDVDGDGVDEVATVEGFHGDVMSLYKQIDGAWEMIYTDQIGFGHGLSSGWLNKTPCITVGQRSDSKDLICYVPSNGNLSVLDRCVVDSGTGTLGTAFITTPEGDGIATANAEPAEYAIYLPKS